MIRAFAPGVVLAAVLSACFEDDYARVERSRGPEVEAPPVRLRGCAPTVSPVVEWLPAPGAPVAGSLHDAYPLCLGEHVAVIRLEGRSDRRVAVVTLETEQRDPAAPATVRRRLESDARGWDRGTVRYRLIRFRADRELLHGRHLRVRLRTADLADGSRWSGPAWPADPAPAVAPAPGSGSPAEALDRISRALRQVTDRLRKANEKPRPRR